MDTTIASASRALFEEVALPVLRDEFPHECETGAFGLFGYGSEAFGLDDELSRDHHWGLRIDALLPDDVPAERRREMVERVAARLPDTFRGYALREGHLPGAGISADSLSGFLQRTLGLTDAPHTWEEWLSLPEEDIVHVTNGQVWHDPSDRFTRIREVLAEYYPDPVWRRRIAHWCRYFSGMGAYALKRALLRDNELYAGTAFGKAIRWGVQLAFLLDRRYFPYDKWLLAYFHRLPRLAEPLGPVVEEAVRLETGWERKLALLDRMSDVLDAAMVADGIIRPHPRFTGSPTSGYRLLEHAYAEILQDLPPGIREIVPVWDQVYLERFHSGYVAGLDLDHWDALLGLARPDGAEG